MWRLGVDLFEGRQRQFERLVVGLEIDNVTFKDLKVLGDLKLPLFLGFG